MLKKTFIAALATLFCAAFGFAQESKTSTEIRKQPEPTRILTEQCKISGETELSGKFDAQFDALKNALPAGANAWAVQIVTTGGFTGRGLPTLTVTSNGDLFVDSEIAVETAQNYSTPRKKLEAAVLEKLSQAINAQSIASEAKTAGENAKIEDAKSMIPPVCSDCYQTSILIARRDADGKIKFLTGESKKPLFSSDELNRIQRIIMEIAGY